MLQPMLNTDKSVDYVGSIFRFALSEQVGSELNRRILAGDKELKKDVLREEWKILKKLSLLYTQTGLPVDIIIKRCADNNIFPIRDTEAFKKQLLGAEHWADVLTPKIIKSEKAFKLLWNSIVSPATS